MVLIWATTRVAMGRVSYNWVASDVTVAVVSRWILAATASAGHPSQSSSTPPPPSGHIY
jgi:hypothetical protein